MACWTAIVSFLSLLRKRTGAGEFEAAEGPFLNVVATMWRAPTFRRRSELGTANMAARVQRALSKVRVWRPLRDSTPDLLVRTQLLYPTQLRGRRVIVE